jgi:small subunit ribosomal protein S1
MTSADRPSSESKAAFSLDDFDKALASHDYQFEQGQTVQGVAIEHTSDGVFVDIGGKSSGFVPAYEASLHSDTPIAESLPIGGSFKFLIIRGQNEEGQVTLSRRQLFVQEAWEKIADLAAKDELVELRVTGSNKGGVTGEIEGLRGFIPRSHLIEKDALDSLIGQRLQGHLIEVDRERNKLVISQRKLARSTAMTQLVKGSLVAGKVVKIQPYGAFVDMKGVTGLLHITQISGTRIDDLNRLLKIGQALQVVILDIDEYKNRISLSTKILEEHPGELVENFEEVMATAGDRMDRVAAKLEKKDSE